MGHFRQIMKESLALKVNAETKISTCGAGVIHKLTFVKGRRKNVYYSGPRKNIQMYGRNVNTFSAHTTTLSDHISRNWQV